MIVVADTGPINHLVQLGFADILHSLYGRVLIPTSVVSELTVDAAPASVRDWVTVLPEWVELVTPTLDVPEAARLGEGERGAIAVCLTRHTDLILIDDGTARRVAHRLKLPVIGTLRVLKDAAEAGLLPLAPTLLLLQNLGFRVSEPLIAEILREEC